MHSAAPISRMPERGLARWRSCVALARPALLAAFACLILTACSPGADYPSLFPAVHDIPPPRADAPLDASQVQQATEDLITERDRLNTEAQGAQSKTSAATEAKAATTSSAKLSAKPSGKSSAHSQVKSSVKTAGGPAAAQKPIRQVSEPPGSDAVAPLGAETR